MSDDMIDSFDKRPNDMSIEVYYINIKHYRLLISFNLVLVFYDVTFI